MSRTVFSIVLFVAAFFFLITDEWTFIVNLLIVLLIHELGHFSMMKLFGYQHVRMLFIPLMGAFVQGKKDVYSQKHSLLVIVMGPFPGILIGYALFYFSGVIKSEWLFDLSVLFMFINMLNLLPLDPLDGGQLFKLLVNNAEELFLLIFSFISSLLLILIGFLLDDFFIMGFGFLMAFRGIAKALSFEKKIQGRTNQVYRSLRKTVQQGFSFDQGNSIRGGTAITRTE
jgi:Zn-dependent protease